jgi:hypothetical protein
MYVVPLFAIALSSTSLLRFFRADVVVAGAASVKTRSRIEVNGNGFLCNPRKKRAKSYSILNGDNYSRIAIIRCEANMC